MEFNDDADLDTSQVDDRRGSGGGGFGGGGGGGLGGIPIPIGGGRSGLIITLVILAIVVCGGGGLFGSGLLGGGDKQGDNTNISKSCDKSNPDRFKNADCRNVLYVNSVQAYWKQMLPQASGKQYQPAKTVFFSNAVNTGCGQADSGVGPFYCPADSQVYIDLTFYNELSSRFGASGEFAAPYVIAHEYGHHIQNLLGTNAKAQQGSQQGANSASVRLELQADCYAGTWANHATETKDPQGDALFKSITESDVAEAIQAAEAIGDDTIQKGSGSRVNPDAFTHGTSAQRKKWFLQGFNTGDPRQCDTFSTNNL
ncbi:neutral zinc metallopeptidase [Dactylosporangium sp. AC04546]|uniref:KPN_02809 family neutral zinc metallopeptidase n=1 Tax=Dactylosporangium sp. AC04546 TaxID=2862460 RepID=UPI001EDE419C|nr:neutral zinc metallopeptidase [Dactylosporangium sp. AC04546]WVK85622.1 neutral zinc metallopeptidase [Dactylosporangium sp. AC04546]